LKTRPATGKAIFLRTKYRAEPRQARDGWGKILAQSASDCTNYGALPAILRRPFAQGRTCPGIRPARPRQCSLAAPENGVFDERENDKEMTFQASGSLLRSPTRGEIAETGDPFSRIPCPTAFDLADPFEDEPLLFFAAGHRIWRRGPSYALFLQEETGIGSTGR
jgi:hypothetical protein